MIKRARRNVKGIVAALQRRRVRLGTDDPDTGAVYDLPIRPRHEVDHRAGVFSGPEDPGDDVDGAAIFIAEVRQILRPDGAG